MEVTLAPNNRVVTLVFSNGNGMSLEVQVMEQMLIGEGAYSISAYCTIEAIEWVLNFPRVLKSNPCPDQKGGIHDQSHEHDSQTFSFSANPPDSGLNGNANPRQSQRLNASHTLNQRQNQSRRQNQSNASLMREPSGTIAQTGAAPSFLEPFLSSMSILSSRLVGASSRFPMSTTMAADGATSASAHDHQQVDSLGPAPLQRPPNLPQIPNVDNNHSAPNLAMGVSMGVGTLGGASSAPPEGDASSSTDIRFAPGFSNFLIPSRSSVPASSHPMSLRNRQPLSSARANSRLPPASQEAASGLLDAILPSLLLFLLMNGNGANPHLQGQPPATQTVMDALKIIPAVDTIINSKCSICMELLGALEDVPLLSPVSPQFPSPLTASANTLKTTTTTASISTFNVSHSDSIVGSDIESENAPVQILRVREMPCMHQYHETCIFEWLGNHSNSCPECRYEVETANEEYNVGVRRRMDERRGEKRMRSDDPEERNEDKVEDETGKEIVVDESQTREIKRPRFGGSSNTSARPCIRAAAPDTAADCDTAPARRAGLRRRHGSTSSTTTSDILSSKPDRKGKKRE